VTLRLAVAALACAVSPAVLAQPAEVDVLDGIDSAYSTSLRQVAERWVPLRSGAAGQAHDTEPGRDEGSLAVTCVSTPGADRYVGMVQRQRIHAALAAVENVLDDVDHFKDLFPGTISVHVLPGSLRTVAGASPASRFDTAWVQRAPVFFLPEIRYEMSHLVEKTAARAVYRYKLRRGDRLIASDGLVVLEAIDAGTTQFTEYDFFNGHWGLLTTWLVWHESLKAAVQSDLAIRIKAEHPGWNDERISSEAKRETATESERLARCFAERQPLRP
jgi:hypothetical protein